MQSVQTLREDILVNVKTVMSAMVSDVKVTVDKTHDFPTLILIFRLFCFWRFCLYLALCFAQNSNGKMRDSN